MGEQTARPVGVGLVGCGWFACRCHIPALLVLEREHACRLVAICSRTRKSMARAEARAGRALRRHAKMDALFADEEVDAVVLALPIPLMAGAIEAALRAGKHVLSEKPAAHSLDAALALAATLRALPPSARPALSLIHI